MSKYIVDGQKLSHVGHNDLLKCYYFTRLEGKVNKLVEVPYSFEGIIYTTNNENVM